ncbi:nSTAND1 domain-containing NTPase [Microcoleus sp. D2_18a_D3]|uniref:nSTAND1 domain-containing NTPase n=1 Tax=Microcoleus sp. D2_18a_D3 TaxID=3055330 RepID=UPI002FD62271
MARYALVIGIAQYQSSNLKPLPKAATDAEVVARVLEEYGQYTVTRLPHRWNAESQRFEVAQQKSVSADEVCEALQNLLLERGTKSDVLIYFAGHGLTFFDNLGEQKGALATSDCQVEMVGRQVVNYKYGIDLSSLNRLIKKSDLSSLVMLLDCCHSGYFLESQLVQQTLTAFSTQKDYYLITACRSFETVKALAGEAHAIFTGALLKGLASENASRNGQVSGDRLFDYISNELKGTQWGQEAIRMGWGRCITLVTYPQLETSATEINFDRQNPYLGLSAFGAEQEKYFCGRDEAVRTLITHLTNSRFLSVIGYSGSGKSSLIKAGLLPDLSRDRIPGSSLWPVESFTPGKHPLGKLVDILARHREQNQLFVIFIDQFEEVFTLCEDEAERQGFIRLIAEEMKDSERKSRMIIALRGDFLIRCANYPDVLNLINHIPTTTYIVKSLGIEELPEAIEKPAELHGVKFERGLVSQIAQDVAGQPGALPLLQYALKELWRVCIEKPEFPEPLLTRKSYEEIGGVQGALENRANVIYQSLSDGDRIFVRKLFMELVQLGEGKEVTRRRVDWDRLRAIADSPEQLERVIGLLAGSQQRLIIVDENTVEVAHEALLCRWKLLSDWIEEDQENIRISRRLEIACREWEETYGKSDDALLTGARLAEVEEWEKRVQPNLTGDEREFLGKSVGRRDREIQAQLEQERQLRELAEANAKVEAARAEEERAKTIAQMERALAAEDKANAETARVKEAEARVRVQKHRTRLAIVSGILLTFTLGLGLLSNVLQGQKREQEASTIGALIGKAEQLLDSHNQLEALIASGEALEEMKKRRRDNNQELQRLQLVIDNVQERNRFQGHQGGVYSAIFSPDGKLIISAGFDKNLRIWNVENQSISPPIPAHKLLIRSVRFSPNGQLFASGSLDKSVNIWNRKGELTQRFLHRDGVYDVSFSNDNQKVAAVGKDGSIMIWNINNPKLEPKTLRYKASLDKKEYKIYGVDFHPVNPSIIVATGFQDYDVLVWDLQAKTNDVPQKLIDSTKYTTQSVRFNSKGTQILTSDNQGGIRIRDSHGTILGKITNNAPIFYAEFSKDGKFIASVSMDEIIKVWRVEDVITLWANKKESLKEPWQKVVVNSGAVNRINFDPTNSQVLVSASEDGIVRIWNLTLKEGKYQQKKLLNLPNLQIQVCNSLEQYFKTNPTNFPSKFRSKESCNHLLSQK